MNHIDLAFKQTLEEKGGHCHYCGMDIWGTVSANDIQLRILKYQETCMGVHQ
jgi:hypothetical protein